MDIWIQKIEKMEYPSAPFHPDQLYPELISLPFEIQIDPANAIYGAVREVLFHLGFDAEHYGSASWNPLKGLVQAGQKVVIKPNFVKGNHILGDKGVESMITHASVIRPLVDYLLLATGGQVDILIGDVPLQSSVWEEIINGSRVKELIIFYNEKDIILNLLDLRKEIALFNHENIISERVPNPTRTESMYQSIDIGKQSFLYEVIQHCKQFEITDYGYGTVPKHHNEERNEYLLPQEILNADLIINIPKLKTHRKAGLTCAMKNLVGVNGDKSWLAHHRRGRPSLGGDEYEHFYCYVYIRERLWNFLKTFPVGVWLATQVKIFFRRWIWHGKSYEETSMRSSVHNRYREGSWHGNDTIWRCIVDLNRIVLYANKFGVLCDKPQRNYLCIVDAILSGEGEGPMEHSPKKTGLVFGGENPVYVDYVASKVMNFDYEQIPMIARAFGDYPYSLTSKLPQLVEIGSNVDEKEWCMPFCPPNGWRNLPLAEPRNTL